jgi:hypothetical protein
VGGNGGDDGLEIGVVGFKGEVKEFRCGEEYMQRCLLCTVEQFLEIDGINCFPFTMQLIRLENRADCN